MSDAKVLPFTAPDRQPATVTFPIAVRMGGNVTTGPEVMRLPDVDSPETVTLLDTLARASASGAVTAVDTTTGVTYVYYDLSRPE